MPETEPNAGAIVKTEGAAESVQVQAETASTALAAAAEADVKAMFALAKRFPRDFQAARRQLLAACDRPRFAATARFRKPVGRKWNPDTQREEENFAEGFSIRFAEEAIRCMGNAAVETVPLWEDAEKRIVRVVATDFERVVRFGGPIVIEKTIERSRIKPGQQVLGTRTNSRGQPVYILRATEDDMASKTAAAVSKAVRTNALRLLPSDLAEEALEHVEKAKSGQRAAESIESRQAKCADQYVRLGVKPEALAQYLGHPLGQATADELDILSDLWVGIHEGETNWREIVAAKEETRAMPGAADESPAAKAVREKLAAAQTKREARKAAKAAPPPAPETPPAKSEPAPVPAAPSAPAAPPPAPAVDEAALLNEQIDAMDATTMGDVGSLLARVQARKPEPPWLAATIRRYQARRRAIEDGEVA